MIVLAFPGLGKTTVASKYKNIIDLESSDYMWTLSKLFEDVPVELRK